MHTEAGILCPYFHNFSHGVQQIEELCHSQKPNSSRVSTIAEYDLGGVGDLFKAPKPIIEEPVISLDPVAAAISMMSCDDDIMSAEVLKVGGIETLENQQTVSKVFYEYEKDLLEKTSLGAAVSEVIDIKLPAVLPSEIPAEENNLPPELSFQKSVSSGCLSSTEWANATSMRPSFLGFPKLDFGSAFGMRRAYSEGDIKTLGGLVICSYTSEDRMQKLSRYRNKKSRRNFGRKIKYACRKALADSQPRIRGRFAKTEESNICGKE